MSLMQLLSAGKTLMGSGEPVGRYRLDTRYRLPKFGSAKNPFTKPAETKPAGQVEMPMAAPMTPPIQKMPERRQLTPEESRVASMKETQRLSVLPGDAPAQERLHPVLAMLDAMELAAIWLKAQAVRLNPARLFPKDKPAAAMAIVPKSTCGPVQTELSLEKVRVMRNDLSDADLEIVPVKVQHKPARNEAAKIETAKVQAAPELAGVEA
jgi:hypothetical protein